MGKTLLITCDYPPMHGGISNYLWHLWSGLPPDEVVILAPAAAGYRRWDRDSGQRIYRKPMPAIDSRIGKPPQIFLLFAHTLSVLAREDIRMIHGGHGISSGVACYFCYKLYAIPYCLYLHGGELQKYRTLGLPDSLFLPIFNNASTLVTNSEYTRAEYESYGVENRFVVLTPGIEPEPYRNAFDTEEVRAKYGLQGRKILLSVGRLVEMKGHDMLIRCLPEMVKQVPDVAYLIVGKGPYRRHLEALASQLGVSERVVFAGYVPDAMLPAHFGCCDVFVQLSRDIPDKGNVEGFGIVFSEAGATGKPVVGGRSGGTPEAIVDGKTGFLVDPLDESEILQAIVKLLTDEGLARRMGEEGRRRVDTQFRWETRIEAVRRLIFDPGILNEKR